MTSSPAPAQRPCPQPNRRSRRNILWEPTKIQSEPQAPTKKLIPYPKCKEVPEQCVVRSAAQELMLDAPCVDLKRVPKKVTAKSPYAVDEVDLMRKELQIQRDINRELKALMVSTLSEDAQCQITSLAEDKIRLARNIDSYRIKAHSQSQTEEELLIENKMWRSKFMAMAIRTDDLSYSLHNCLRLLKSAQSTVLHISSLLPSIPQALAEQVDHINSIDILKLYNKSPCDEGGQHAIQRKTPNLTINCCKRCSGREMKLI